MWYNQYMKSGKVKNFNIHFQKLIDYAKLCKIEIHKKKSLTSDETEEGKFTEEDRHIDLSWEMNQKELLATLLHELGHFEDYMVVSSKKLDRAYNLLNEDKPITLIEKRLIVKCEKRAWAFGRILAKKFNIPLGYWYSREEQKALATYKAVKTIKR